MFVTNDRYTIWICDKDTHVWVLKSQFHKTIRFRPMVSFLKLLCLASQKKNELWHKSV